MVRPSHLPEFRDPPLQEVVLGVQFRTPDFYQQIYAGRVWDIFREHYPFVEEYPALPPSFETFGPQLQMSANIELVTAARHDRFWFISEDGYQLIQFQHDRLIHNWRKMGVPENHYPRFERMIADFELEINKLQDFMKELGSELLEMNQCEVTYINSFDLSDLSTSRPASWFRGFDLPKGGPENFRYSYNRDMVGRTGSRIGRLYIDAMSATLGTSSPVVQLQLSARGAPEVHDVNGAIEFLRRGREMIVTEFAEITSERAQQEWDRLQ
jgi:uncharacterized protein (TIGR04255 family)